MAGNVHLYRFTNTTDTIINVLDKIDFNASKDTRSPNPFVTNADVTDSTAIGDNQAVEQDTGDQQHLGKIEDLYVLYGYISNRPSDSTYIKLLKKWDDEPKVNTNWANGRFAVAFDDFTDYSLTPIRTGTAQKGLMWMDLSWKIDWKRHPPNANFVLRLKISRSDGT